MTELAKTIASAVLQRNWLEDVAGGEVPSICFFLHTRMESVSKINTVAEQPASRPVN